MLLRRGVTHNPPWEVVTAREVATLVLQPDGLDKHTHHQSNECKGKVSSKEQDGGGIASRVIYESAWPSRK